MTSDIYCPKCRNKRIWKDGFRYPPKSHPVQRYLCRDCGYRFSSPSGQALYKSYLRNKRCQVGVSETEGTKNLTEVEIPKEGGLRGATETDQATVKGKIVEFTWNLYREGSSPETISTYTGMLKRILKLGADLFDPETVKDVIARQEWSNATKYIAVEAYKKFAEINGISWKAPRYRIEGKIPFIPLESELDALIAGCGKKTATVLQLLKETGMRIGQAARLRWEDLDFESKVIRINNPEKHGRARVLKVSSKLLNMLGRLPRNHVRVFGGSTSRALYRNYYNQRKRIASKLQNPRLLRITFHTFRHWKATMEYRRTRDILYVMRLLGHKRIENTLIYTQLSNSLESDEFHSATATSVEEARKLIEDGFEYVCQYEGTMLFRKRK